MAEPIDGDADDTPRDPRWRLTPTKIIVGVLLLVPIVVPILVPTYAMDGPRLGGFPFFYWYQLLWVFLCAGITGVCYLVIRRAERRYAASHREGDA